MSHSLERLFSPGIEDIVFPFVAFFLVIILPSTFAVLVIVRVLRGRYSGDDQRN